MLPVYWCDDARLHTTLAATSTTFGASSGDLVGLEVYHGSTDAPAVDILADANAGVVLVPSLAYGSFSGYVEVPASRLYIRCSSSWCEVQ